MCCWTFAGSNLLCVCVCVLRNTHVVDIRHFTFLNRHSRLVLTAVHRSCRHYIQQLVIIPPDLFNQFVIVIVFLFLLFFSLPFLLFVLGAAVVDRSKSKSCDELDRVEWRWHVRKWEIFRRRRTKKREWGNEIPSATANSRRRNFTLTNEMLYIIHTTTVYLFK